MTIWIQRGLIMALSLSQVSIASSSVTIVSSHGEILPIEKIASSAQTRSEIQSHQNASSEQELLAKYGTIENALYRLDDLSPSELNVLQQIALKDMTKKHRKIAKAKHDVRVLSISDGIDQSNEVHKASNNPEQIIERRVINDQINQAQRKPIYETVVDMTSETIDPELNQLINVNTMVNRPTAISFYDSMGNPYPIVNFLPKESTPFKFEPFNENILIVTAEQNHNSISGFVFLKAINQPIPIMYNANPNSKVDVKKNIHIPITSPDAKLSVSPISESYSSLTQNDERAMFAFLNGRSMSGSERITIDGLPPRSQAWKYKKHIYIKTTANMKHDIIGGKSSGNWKIYKAYPRSSYWFSINGRDTEVFVNE
ncbi:DotH/IcmK family type IV secretion protein [Vibrio sp. R78045]|uniref:DotH/IcmK family type IV secretion protein n=1 Tax=Vibrio sp. R78045 TaxID=3093868 RepID=UPI0036F239FE